MNINLQETFNEFLNDKNINYKPALDSFQKFLNEKNIYTETVKTYFQGIRSNQLVDSLNYFINSNNITSFSRCNTYASCLKEYFIYIISKDYVKNDELMTEFSLKTYDEKSYRYKINNFIANKECIKNSSGFESFNDQDIYDLIEDCNNTMNDLDILKKADKMKINFNKYTSALGLKLILLTGIKYLTLTNIRVSDLDLKHCSITINGLTIHLPNDLSDQFNEYVSIRSRLINNKNNDFLFIKFDGDKISKQTSTISSFMAGLTGRRDLNGLIQYTITNMIKQGINQSIIIKFTGIGGKTSQKQSIYDYCQNRVNEQLDVNSSRYLDSNIRAIKIFDIL